MAQRWALPPDVNCEKATNDAIAYSCKKIGHFYIAYFLHNRISKNRFFFVFCVSIFDRIAKKNTTMQSLNSALLHLHLMVFNFCNKSPCVDFNVSFVCSLLFQTHRTQGKTQLQKICNFRSYIRSLFY